VSGTKPSLPESTVSTSSRLLYFGIVRVKLDKFLSLQEKYSTKSGAWQTPGAAVSTSPLIQCHLNVL